MRKVTIERKTKETSINLTLNLDGEGRGNVETGIGFFDHMMTLFYSHGGFDMELKAAGDIEVDAHHSVEDIGIVLGKAIHEALGDKKGIKRYSSVSIPMDEALCSCTIDVSGRPYLVYNAKLCGKSGDFDLELVEEFLRAVATYGGLTIHINLLYGANGHHMAEAVFKSFARALSDAVEVVSDRIPSSKGILE